MYKSLKEQVMEVLINVSPDELSHEAFIWASSHLPDDAESGSYRTSATKTVYQHDLDNILQACGFESEEDSRKVLDELEEYKKGLPVNEAGMVPVSRVVEKLLVDYYETGNDRLVKFMVIMFFIRPNMPDDPIAMLIRLLGSRRGK